MPKRSSRVLRLFTLVFVLLFGLNASHAATAFKPSACANCPPDCPMHKHKRKCHEVGGKGDHCQRKAKAAGLYGAGCKSRAEALIAADPPSLLVSTMKPTLLHNDALAVVAELGAYRDGFELTPLHPPSCSVATS